MKKEFFIPLAVEVEEVGNEEMDDTVEGLVEVAQQEKRVMIMKLGLWRSSVTNI